MFNLITANNIYDLSLEFSKNLNNYKQDNPLNEIDIIIPNYNTAEFLRKTITTHKKVSAGLKFKSIETFIFELVKKQNSSNYTILMQEKLFHKLLDNLYNPVFYSQDLQLLQQYIWGITTPNTKPTVEIERKIFQIATKISGLFNEYSLSRYELIKKWKNKEYYFTKQEDLNLEQWQMALWNKIFDEKSENKAVPIGIYLKESTFEKNILPEQVNIVASPYLSIGYIDFFAEISQKINVNFYVFNPSEEYWFDLPTNKYAKAKEHKKLQNLNFSKENTIENQNEILMLLGKAAKDFLNLLGNKNEYDFTIVKHPTNFENNNILNRIKQDIKNNQKIKTENFIEMQGFKLIEAPTKQKEIEYISDQIWHTIKNNNNFRFSDIAVFIPNTDEKYEYLTIIKSEFKKFGNIPVEFLDNISYEKNYKFLDAIDLLSKIPMGKFTVKDVMSFLSNDIVLHKIGEENKNIWIKWVDELKIYRDPKKPDNFYTEKDIFNWKQGLIRLSLGAFMEFSNENTEDNDNFLIVHNFTTPPDNGNFKTSSYIPYGLNKSYYDTAANFIETINVLINFYDSSKIENYHTLKEWSDLFLNTIHYFFSDYTLSNIGIWNKFLNTYHKYFKNEYVTTNKTGYTTFKLILDNVIKQLQTSEKTFKYSGVAVASFDSIFTLPFKKVFMCGINEGMFPSSANEDPLDLRFLNRQIGDLTPKERDNHIFLEILMNTSEEINILWRYKNSINESTLYPSEIPNQFINLLNTLNNDDKSLLKNKIILKLSENYQDEDAGFYPEYSPEFIKETNAYVIGKQYFKQNNKEIPEDIKDFLKIRKFPENPSEFKDKKYNISISVLKDFLEFPVQGSIAYLLRGSYEEELQYESEIEPFSTDNLEKYIIRRYLFEKFLKSYGFKNENEINFEIEKILNYEEHKGKVPAGILKNKIKADLFENVVALYNNKTKNPDFPWGKFKKIAFGRTREQEKDFELKSAISIIDPQSNNTYIFRGLTSYFYKNENEIIFLNIASQSIQSDLKNYISFIMFASLFSDKIFNMKSFVLDKETLKPTYQIFQFNSNNAKPILLHWAKLLTQGFIEHRLSFEAAKDFLIKIKEKPNSYDNITQQQDLLQNIFEKLYINGFNSNKNKRNIKYYPWLDRLKIPKEPITEINKIWKPLNNNEDLLDILVNDEFSNKSKKIKR